MFLLAEGSMRQNLKHYPIATPYLKMLEELQDTHRLRKVEFWDNESMIFPQDLPATLPGKNVIINFNICSSTSGMECHICSLQLL